MTTHLVETISIRFLKCASRMRHREGTMMRRGNGQSKVQLGMGASSRCHEILEALPTTMMAARTVVAPTCLHDSLTLPWRRRRRQGGLRVGVVLRVAKGHPLPTVVAEEGSIGAPEEGGYVWVEVQRPLSKGPWRRELFVSFIHPGTM